MRNLRLCDNRITDPKHSCGWLLRFGEMITWKITFFCLTVSHLENGESAALSFLIKMNYKGISFV